MAAVVLLRLLIVTAVTMAQQCNEYGFYCVDEHHFQECPGEGLPPAGNVNNCGDLFCSMDCDIMCMVNVPCTTTTTDLPTTTTVATTTAVTTTTTPPFLCESEGSFPDPDDCSLFYSCVPKDGGGGDFWTLRLSCPHGSLFDSGEGRCSINATCGDGDGHGTCNEYGFRCVDATHGQLCPDEGLPPQGEVFSCPQGSSCREGCQYLCWADGDATCPTLPPPTAPPPPYSCSEEGKFADPDDCAAFFACSRRDDGSFALIRFSCPQGSGFDADSGRCSQGSDCHSCNAYGFSCVDGTHVQLCDGSVPAGAVTECPAGTRCRPECPLECSADTEACPTEPPPTTAPPPGDECENEGRFPVPEDCSRYIVCSPASNRLVRVEFSCPPGTAYDPASQRCGADVTCGGPCNGQGFFCVDSTHVRLCERGETRPAPGAATVTCPAGTTCDMECLYECWGGVEACPPAFRCQQQGRFPAPHNCTYFYVCSATASGDFFQLLVPCPEGSRFDVATSKCSTEAVCAAPQLL